jgi:cytokinesis protein
MFINILLCFEDRKGDPFPALPVRLSRRMEMQRCGLSDVIDRLSTFQSQDAQLEEELEKFHDREAIDKEEEIMDQDRQLLQDLDDPVELCQTIVTQLGESRARNFFLSSLRQTLLMTTKRDPDQRIRYFQIINELVQGIVLNQEPGYDRDITDLMNIPIQRVFGRYEEADKVEQAERQIQERNLQILRLERERDKLKSELDGVEGGLINQLKKEKLDLEGKLRTSRGVSEGLQHDLNKLKKEYEERIHDLEATVDELERRIMELLAMLKQSQNLEDIINQKSSHGYHRKELYAELEKESDRYYARQQLEGRTGPGIAASRRIASMRLLSSREATRALDSSSSESGDDFEDEDQKEVEEDAFEDADAESGHIMFADRAALAQGQKRALQQKNKGRKEIVSTSQFVDAEDDKVRAHEARAMLASGESASVSGSVELELTGANTDHPAPEPQQRCTAAERTKQEFSG